MLLARHTDSIIILSITDSLMVKPLSMKVEKNNADAYLMRVNLILIRMEEAKHRILHQLVKMVLIKPLTLKLLIRGIGMFFFHLQQ